MNVEALEQNELLFLQQHRSAVWDMAFGQLFVSSDRSVKTWNFLGALTDSTGDDASQIVATAEAVFADWQMTPCIKITPRTSPPSLEAVLKSAGWKVAVTLAHMVYEQTSGSVAGNTLKVRECRSDQDILLFTGIQSDGFGVPQWRDWVGKVNLINSRRGNQVFYIAEDRGEPAGVALLLMSGAVGGLYAVTTLPAFRGRGVARALAHAAIEECQSRGLSTLCLNTLNGGPAQEAFRRFGFRNEFDSRFFVRD
jgi:GNAT superfamily N-acetyltransferase